MSEPRLPAGWDAERVKRLIGHYDAMSEEEQAAEDEAAANASRRRRVKGMALDTQVVELLGRQRLMEELLRDGLEVAVPARDRGVDLIAYADLSQQVKRFAARPLQMKAFTASGFSVAQKYTRIADLLMAYVWHLGEAAVPVTYGLPYAAAVEIAGQMGWTETAAWKEGGVYTTTSPSKRLLALLEPHRMERGKWWVLVVGNENVGLPPS